MHMKLSQNHQNQIIDLYVNNQKNITAVVYEMMAVMQLRWKDVYPLVSAFLHDSKLIRHGQGKRFKANFGWKKKHCDACKEEFQPTGRAQRICKKCTGDRPDLVTTYGITISDYDQLFQVQNGACAICYVALSSLAKNQIHIDHDHDTSYVRGILCTFCNTRLSALEDKTWTSKATVYLSKQGIKPRCECVSTRSVKKFSKQ